MVIHRLAPGERVPIAGRYALVGHYGEETNVSIRCEAGDELPSLIVASDFGPFWFYRVDEANEDSRAA